MSVVYDSAVDVASVCDMTKNVSSKRNVAVIVFTTGGGVFCGFHSIVVTREGIVKDPTIFFFAFKSHERCCVLQRCVVKNKGGEGFTIAFLKRTSFGRLRLVLAVVPFP